MLENDDPDTYIVKKEFLPKLYKIWEEWSKECSNKEFAIPDMTGHFPKNKEKVNTDK